MTEIECPYCYQEQDAGNYPVLKRGWAGDRVSFILQCPACHVVFHKDIQLVRKECICG